MAWGEDAAERHEMQEPTELVRPDGSVRNPTAAKEPDWAAERSAMLWGARQRDVKRAEELLKHQQKRLWEFMEERAVHGVSKPYEICGAEDAWHPREDEGTPAYDEDDLVPGLTCQLPKGHQDLGYRNHLEMSPDGEVMGAWG